MSECHSDAGTADQCQSAATPVDGGAPATAAASAPSPVEATGVATTGGRFEAAADGRTVVLVKRPKS